MNKKLDKHIIDKKTGIKYTLVGDYYIPDLEVSNNKRYFSSLLGRYDE